MIKKFRFFDSSDEANTYAKTDLPLGAAYRPLRVVVCHALHDAIPDQAHEAVVIEWFETAPPYDPFIDSGDFEAEEQIGRGADWLEKRWAGGDTKIKHMAIAKRAAGLTPEGFSELWKTRAGTVKAPGGGPVVTIPDVAKGLAYVQNHQLPPPDESWLYDAVNEVYFDDLDSLRQRIAFFDEHLGDQTEDDLVSESSFLAVREEIVLSR